MTESIPETLQIAIAEGELIPMVGAGSSLSLVDKDGKKMFPSWSQLLSDAECALRAECKTKIADIVKCLIELEDFQQAAKYAYEGLKGSSWSRFIKRKFDIDYSMLNDSSAELPRAIWKISNRIITLNYDRVLYWACEDNNNLSEIDNNSKSELVSFVKKESTRPVVWHLHGRIDNCTELILTPNGYDKLYATKESTKSNYSAALESLKSLITYNSILFIGCSMNDAELIKQINRNTDIFSSENATHYAIVRKKEFKSVEQKLNGTNICPLPVAEYGEPMVTFINQLEKIGVTSDILTNNH